jgi:CubicO group peptidase (beta-lactamase class C family)
MFSARADSIGLRALSALLPLALFCATLGVAAPAADLNQALASAMKGTKTPALSLLVMHGGKIAQVAVRGVRRNDGHDPVRIDDVWLIGSDAKPMTATLVAKLVDRGVLSWNAPLSRMLPGLASHMRPEYRNVTLVQLLSHRAGLPHDYHDLKYFNTFFSDRRPAEQQRLDYVAHALTDGPVAPPGTKFSYSNTGFMIAAVILERKAGASYEALMQREVFNPLGMRSAGFGVTPAGQPQGHHAGKVAGLKDANPAMFAPAGNIHLSLRDWAAFCLDQMAGYHGQGRLLKSTTYRMMETRLPGAETGLSWGVQDSALGRKGPALMHAGSDGNWMALVLLFPQTQNGVLVAANAGDDMGGDKATKAALKIVLPELAPPAGEPVKPQP